MTFSGVSALSSAFLTIGLFRESCAAAVPYLNLADTFDPIKAKPRRRPGPAG